MDYSNAERAATDFLDWADATYPGSKDRILRAIDTAPGGMGAAPTEKSVPWYTQVLDAAKVILPTFAQYKVQSKITKLQLDRAKAGLPPIDASQYTAPPITVQHEIVAQKISPQTKTMLWVGGGIVLALLLIPLLRR